MSPRSATTAALDQRLIQGLLPRLRIFWGVAPSSLGPLMKQCWVLAAPRGSSVVQRGARLPGTFGLCYGSLKLSLRSDDGEERVVRLVAAAETFGEANALLGRACQSEVVALSDAQPAALAGVL